MALDRKTIKGAMSNLIGRPESKAALRSAAAEKGGYVAPASRQGRRGLLTYQDPVTIRQLRELAVEHDTSQQALMTEALNMLFTKYGKPPVA